MYHGRAKTRIESRHQQCLCCPGAKPQQAAPSNGEPQSREDLGGQSLCAFVPRQACSTRPFSYILRVITRRRVHEHFGALGREKRPRLPPHPAVRRDDRLC
ncbi:unnamed protein product [Scytosiphon promiscuus]